MIRNLARLTAVALVALGGAVACSEDTPACAATVAEPMNPTSQQTYKPPKVNPPPQKPAQQRTTSRVQDKPKTTSTTTSGKKTTTIKPNWKSTSKPTTWGGYKQDRNWNQPYRKNMPVPQQPVIVNVYNHDYRTYPGYAGYYPVGVWPVGYGAHYGCVAETEAPAETPTPAPTVTVTAPPPVTVTVPPSATPSETPR